MNNRLKFRVWYKDEKRYRPQNEEGGLFVLSGDGSLWFHYYDPSISSPEYGNIQRCCKSRFVIEQSTGLRDKNGDLIYEGDILKTVRNSFLDEFKTELKAVVYGELSARWKLGERSCIALNRETAEESEIVGNVHENPELLEDKK